VVCRQLNFTGAISALSELINLKKQPSEKKSIIKLIFHNIPICVCM